VNTRSNWFSTVSKAALAIVRKPITCFQPPCGDVL
jgi:hypothetical protein